MTADDALIPWIQTNQDLPMSVDMLGIGRPVENMPPCIRNYTE